MAPRCIASNQRQPSSRDRQDEPARVAAIGAQTTSSPPPPPPPRKAAAPIRRPIKRFPTRLGGEESFNREDGGGVEDGDENPFRELLGASASASASATSSRATATPSLRVGLARGMKSKADSRSAKKPRHDRGRPLAEGAPPPASDVRRASPRIYALDTPGAVTGTAPVATTTTAAAANGRSERRFNAAGDASRVTRAPASESARSTSSSLAQEDADGAHTSSQVVDDEPSIPQLFDVASLSDEGPSIPQLMDVDEDAAEPSMMESSINGASSFPQTNDEPSIPQLIDETTNHSDDDDLDLDDPSIPSIVLPHQTALDSLASSQSQSQSIYLAIQQSQTQSASSQQSQGQQHATRAQMARRLVGGGRGGSAEGDDGWVRVQPAVFRSRAWWKAREPHRAFTLQVAPPPRDAVQEFADRLRAQEARKGE